MRAWVRIPFAAIFADIPRGWFKLMTSYLLLTMQTSRKSIWRNTARNIADLIYLLLFYIIALTHHREKRPLWAFDISW